MLFFFVIIRSLSFFFFFFFNDTATTEIYTLSLHDALPIFIVLVMMLLTLTSSFLLYSHFEVALLDEIQGQTESLSKRSEEHTSELQSQSNLVCRLLLEKKKKIKSNK